MWVTVVKTFFNHQTLLFQGCIDTSPTALGKNVLYIKNSLFCYWFKDGRHSLPYMFLCIFVCTSLCFHRIWQLFNEYVRLILTLSKPDAQESNLSRAKLKSIPSLIRYVNTCKRMDAMCLTLPRTFPVHISERPSAHLLSQTKSTPDQNSPKITRIPFKYGDRAW